MIDRRGLHADAPPYRWPCRHPSSASLSPTGATGGTMSKDSGTTAKAITSQELRQRLGAFPPPTPINVPPQSAFRDNPVIIPGSMQRPPLTMSQLSFDPQPWTPAFI